jgi:peptidoglycan/xylan/chitin deacetylase (PgdA/CDA1 family)
MVLLLVGAIVVVVGLVVFWMEPLGVLGVLEWLTPNIVYRVRTELPLVALSFDDGPHPEFTPQVLEILKRHEAKATFFLIGERALRYPEVVARIRALTTLLVTRTARLKSCPDAKTKMPARCRGYEICQ